MKEQRLAEALNEIDETYLHALYEEKPKKTRKFLPYLVAAACLCLVVFGAMLFRRGQQPTLPQFSSAVQYAGGSFEAECIYDPSSLHSANPWNEDAALNSLPVYENLAYTDGSGAPVYLSEEAMRRLAEETAVSLGTQIQSTALDLHRDSPLCLLAETERGTVWVWGDGAVRFEFSEPLELPRDFAGTAPTGEMLLYLAQNYPWIDLEQPVAEVEQSYNFYGEATLDSCRLYDGSGELRAQILSYHFGSYSFHFTEDGKLESFSKSNDLRYSARLLGDYPIISVEEAEQLLLEGSYFSSVPASELKTGEIRAEDVVKAELIYRSGNLSQVYQPYYCFYVQLRGSYLQAEGLQSVGCFYVPAVEAEYLTDFPG
ncbi:MAG: hypothetical protein IJA48_00340 [Oscillospiraceae bacterium]|nr:hypothetical protein [Oscillospiraceae bacterium]